MDDGRTFTDLAQIFDRGFKVAGPNAPYIGYRPTVSTNPLKFAGHFVWSTWAEVAKRRLDVGSGVENLFRSGGAIKANGLETVGLWSANTPGVSLMISHVPRLLTHGHLAPTSLAAHAFFLFFFAEWRILDLALSFYGKVVVPLYENFGPDSIGTSSTPSATRRLSPTHDCNKSTCTVP